MNFGTDLIKSELKDDPLYELNVNNITTENDIVEEREHTIFPVEEFKKKEEDNFEELINHEFDPLIEDDCIDETQSSMDDEFTTIEESTENEIVIPSKFSMSYENDDYVSSVDDLDVVSIYMFAYKILSNCYFELKSIQFPTIDITAIFVVLHFIIYQI